MHVHVRDMHTHMLPFLLSFFLFPYAYVSSELPLPTSIGLFILHKLILVIDLVTALSLITEIILKWIDDFKHFWTNGWNILDLAITSAVRKILCISEVIEVKFFVG